MVTVREISRVRASVCILLDSGEKYWLREADIPAAGIREGMSFETEEFLQKIHLCQYPRALNHAVSMLARRPCSRKEITTRLVRLHCTEDVAELVVCKLEKEKLLDDGEFCEQWIRYRLSKGCGPGLIRRELKMKGIPDRMIDKALEETDSDEQENNAVTLARKSWKRVGTGGDLRKNRQKVITSLVRKGYDWETAGRACREAEEETE